MSIIVLLMSILLPCLWRAKESAYELFAVQTEVDEEGKEQASFDLGIRHGEVSFAVSVTGLPPGGYIYAIRTEKGAFHGKFRLYRS